MKDTIRIAGVVRESIVDGPGLRFAVFTQGCAHHCPECQNPETWDFNGGALVPLTEVKKALDEKGITIPYNQLDVTINNNDIAAT